VFVILISGVFALPLYFRKSHSEMSNTKTAVLVLEDGTQFKGFSFGAEVSVSGEVVFNTAMMGYPETLTDPSYRGQILVLTYPLIGNYGVPPFTSEGGLLTNFESNGIQITALVVADYTEEFSHWNGEGSLGDWLKESGVPAIYGVDTRAITKHIREKGAMLGKVVIEGQDEPAEFTDPNLRNLVAEVSTDEVKTYGEGDVIIALIDCGVKYNIIRSLVRRGARVVRVPWDFDVTTIEWDGLMLANGPGDPKMAGATVENIRKAMKLRQPIFGICMGNQLLSMAAGADTYKLKYGHRSHNQPVLEVGTNRAMITSQNHGFAVDPSRLSSEWEAWFVNLNDGTNEGIRHRELPFCSVQFHPEATSGPVDAEVLFDQFIETVKQHIK
jgi:carbamoyl-phosphate synthase small subunit